MGVVSDVSSQPESEASESHVDARPAKETRGSVAASVDFKVKRGDSEDDMPAAL